MPRYVARVDPTPVRGGYGNVFINRGMNCINNSSSILKDRENLYTQHEELSKAIKDYCELIKETYKEFDKDCIKKNSLWPERNKSYMIYQRVKNNRTAVRECSKRLLKIRTKILVN